MPRGGRRGGAPGKAYANRSDLTDGANKQPIRVKRDQPYGARQETVERQRAMPLPAMPEIVPLGADTTRPQEPVTAGVPLGPGPGPAAAGLDVDPVSVLAEIYRLDPNEDLRHLLEVQQRLERS